MKKLYYSITMLLMAFGFVACAGYDAELDADAVVPEITLDVTYIQSVDGVAMDITIPYTTDQDEVSVVSSQDWCIINEVTQEAISVTIQENPSDLETREAIITVTTGPEENPTNVFIVVSQDRLLTDARVTFIIDDAYYYDTPVLSSATGNSITGSVSFETNRDYSLVDVDSNSSWCVATVNSTASTIEIAATQNQVEQERTATITITSGSGDDIATAYITVYQAASEAVSLVIDLDSAVYGETTDTADLDIDVATKTLDMTDGDLISMEIPYTTNREDYSIKSSATWCSVEISADAIYISADRNSSTDTARTAEVSITVGLGDDAHVQVITLTQQGASLVAAAGIYLEEYDGCIFYVDENFEYCKIVSPEQPDEVKTGSTGSEAYYRVLRFSTSEEGYDMGTWEMTSDGYEATQQILSNSQYSDELHPAVAFCNNLPLAGGLYQWYLPAIEELQLLVEETVATAVIQGMYAQNSEWPLLVYDQFHWSSTESDTEDSIAESTDEDGNTVYTTTYRKIRYAKQGSSSGASISKHGGFSWKVTDAVTAEVTTTTYGRFVRAVACVPVPDRLKP